MAVSVRKPVLYAFGVVLCAGIIGGIWLWYRTHCVLITNDSRIEGTLVSVASRLSDRVVQVMVNEGDTVHKGQGLVRIDSRSVMARKAKAEAALELAKARWEDAKAGFRRQEIMAAQANVAAAQEELALKKEGSRPEVIRAAEAQVMQAQAELDEINVLCQDSVIPSPVNGVVAQKLVSAGELVAAGQKLFTLVNTDDIWLNARIEETRIGQIRVGQDVAFTIDGYPGRTFSGRIYEINPAACSVFSLISTENVAGYFTKIMQRVPVKISLPRLDSPETDPGEPEVVFRIGMQGTIEIQL
ncbi:HlyD family secretion protein [Bilophila wadsworthia]|uniref:HlyD family secretion protein n=1 Tax=Bilophila wadsworthia TaxID=35833 RepID=UPI00242E1912|nr:efflux RND transporter periplasmic adaptor subunit [Bilophila wadsworthia]